MQKIDESIEEFINRICLGLKMTLEMTRDPIPLIIGHGGSYMAICEILKVKPQVSPNCSMTFFSYTNNHYNQINCYE